MKLLNILCITLLTAGVASANSIGGPFDPAYRYGENSVFAVFENGFPGFEPTEWHVALFEPGPSIYPLSQQQPEVFGDENIIDILLPNFIDELPMKMMRIQMLFDAPVNAEDIFVIVDGFDSVAGTVPGNLVGGSFGSHDVWHYMDFEIFPNPDEERIFIEHFFPERLMTVIVDTVSIPEPASLGLLGLVTGGTFFLRRFFVV